MHDIKNVLFPVDFSLHCRGVAPFVRALTGHFKARLTLIHGIAIPPEYQPGQTMILNTLWYARVDSNHRPFAPEANAIHVSCLFFDGFDRQTTSVFGSSGAYCGGNCGGSL